MPNYKRYHQRNACYFFTVVAHRRKPIFTTTEFRNAFRDSIEDVKRLYPFSSLAWVLLPDHLHCIWSFPDDDLDYSRRWSIIKRNVSQNLPRDQLGSASLSRYKRKESAIWQRRFWEHQIRDDRDLRKYLDYCYWNPVKHGLVDRVSDWPFSTFHRDVRNGLYPQDWGGGYDEAEGVFGE